MSQLPGVKQPHDPGDWASYLVGGARPPLSREATPQPARKNDGFSALWRSARASALRRGHSPISSGPHVLGLAELPPVVNSRRGLQSSVVFSALDHGEQPCERRREQDVTAAHSWHLEPLVLIDDRRLGAHAIVAISVSVGDAWRA